MELKRSNIHARILLIRPDHLGDVLLTLPAVRALRRALPDAHITYLVGDSTSEAPRHCPDIDESFTLPFPPPTAPTDPSGWADVVAREATILSGHFDMALLFRPDDPWSGALVAAAEIPLRLGYDWPRTRPFLNVVLPVQDQVHAAALALDLVQTALTTLGIPASTDIEILLQGRFVPNVEDRAEVDSLLGLISPVVGVRPIVLHPGSGWQLKNWLSRRWGELAIQLHRRYRVAPLVVGGPGEQDLVESVVHGSRGCAYGLAEPLSLGALAMLHQRARAVVATDSGPLHLAALVGAPVVGLYGPADAQVFGPLCPPDRARIVCITLPCSPCNNLSDPPCGASVEPACVTGIPVEAVLAAVDTVLCS